MSYYSRIIEARLHKGYTQEYLAQRVGVAKSTMNGYEKGKSEPSIDTLIKIMAVLDIDANYLFQDEMTSPSASAMPTPAELEHIKKYRDLDDHGTRMVNMVLDEEYTRISVPEASAPVTPLSDPFAVNAAHELDPTPEERKHADEIMMNDEEWK